MTKELTRPDRLPRYEVMSVGIHHRARLMREIQQMIKRGEIGSVYDLRHTSTGWHVKIVRIAPRPSWWSRNGLRASLWSVAALGLLSLVAAVVRLILIVLAGALPFLIGGGVFLAVASLLAGPRVISVVQRVDIRR